MRGAIDMSYKRINFFSVFCLSCLILTSCRDDGSSLVSISNETSFRNQISTEEINTYFSVEETRNVSYTFPPKSRLSVGVKNISDAYIEFENDFGTRIFYFDLGEQKWIEVENRVSYHGESGEINDLFPEGYEGGPFDYQFVRIVPALEGIDLPVLVRIYFEGTVEEEGVEKNVGGYVDIQFTSSE